MTDFKLEDGDYEFLWRKGYASTFAWLDKRLEKRKKKGSHANAKHGSLVKEPKKLPSPPRTTAQSNASELVPTWPAAVATANAAASTAGSCFATTDRISLNLDAPPPPPPPPGSTSLLVPADPSSTGTQPVGMPDEGGLLLPRSSSRGGANEVTAWPPSLDAAFGSSRDLLIHLASTDVAGSLDSVPEDDDDQRSPA